MNRLNLSGLARSAGTAAVLAGLLASSGCSDAVRQGRGSGYLVVDSIAATSGADPSVFTNYLQSDVQTLVKTKVNINGEDVDVKVPTIFEDPARVILHLNSKDPASPVSPTNSVTISRYRVVYKRTDGRDTQGVDVPYAFDGAVTATIPADGSAITVGFVLVRAASKQEPPLRALVGGGGALYISTLAEITFYGRDQAGNEVSVTGTITINFADWGDPES